MAPALAASEANSLSSGSLSVYIGSFLHLPQFEEFESLFFLTFLFLYSNRFKVSERVCLEIEEKEIDYI